MDKLNCNDYANILHLYTGVSSKKYVRTLQKCLYEILPDHIVSDIIDYYLEPECFNSIEKIREGKYDAYVMDCQIINFTRIDKQTFNDHQYLISGKLLQSGIYKYKVIHSKGDNKISLSDLECPSITRNGKYYFCNNFSLSMVHEIVEIYNITPLYFRHPITRGERIKHRKAIHKRNRIERDIIKTKII